MADTSQDKILCVDDEQNILDMFRRTLGRQFALFTASSAADALRILQHERDIAVIMSDYSMPGANGLEFLQRAGEISPDSVQIVLTGNIEIDVAIKAINEATSFATCPNLARWRSPKKSLPTRWRTTGWWSPSAN
ncbi:response regulator [Methylomonas koyamae]|uniref:response regulator n=1 Tax=Methylomonas koyamae TaxID=702114 RepID=UPI0006D037AE|nr:response regulator [Methylomonas koyamae]